MALTGPLAAPSWFHPTYAMDLENIQAAGSKGGVGMAHLSFLLPAYLEMEDASPDTDGSDRYSNIGSLIVWFWVVGLASVAG